MPIALFTQKLPPINELAINPLYHISTFLKIFLLGIFLVYIFNAIPKVPHTHPPNPLPTHCPFLVLVFPCTGAYKVCMSNGPLFAVMAN